MRIEFEFSGGYGGLFAAKPLSYRVETAELPEETRDKLLQLVGASGLLALDPGAVPATPGKARDAFSYKLSLRDHGTDKTFVFDDVSAPPAARPLLDYLRELAIETKRR